MITEGRAPCLFGFCLLQQLIQRKVRCQAENNLSPRIISPAEAEPIRDWNRLPGCISRRGRNDRHRRRRHISAGRKISNGLYRRKSLWLHDRLRRDNACRRKSLRLHDRLRRDRACRRKRTRSGDGGRHSTWRRRRYDWGWGRRRRCCTWRCCPGRGRAEPRPKIYL